MKVSLPSAFLLVLLSLAAVVSDLSAQATNIFKTDFSDGTSGWRGREGEDSVRPDVTVAEDPANAGENVLKVMTNGRLGCGFRFTPPVEFEIGHEYRLTFRIRCSAAVPVTARITNAEFTKFGEDVPNWFRASGQDVDAWHEVEHFFSPTAPNVGLEIAVGVKAYEPFEILIAAVQIDKQ